MCLVGVVVRRYRDFLIHVLLIPTSLFFAAAFLLFVHLKKMFFVLIPVFFKLNFMY